MSQPGVREGAIRHHGFETWYRVVGESEPGKLPVLCLHGGPGSPCDYLEPLEGLAATGRQVVFYDQVGCGRSSQPSDPDLWNVPLFIEELDAVRDGLGLDRLHLLGHSWGGMLAMEYLLTSDDGVASVVLASAPSSSQLLAREAARLRSELPPEIKDVLEAHEKSGTMDDPAYEEAVLAFYHRHACRTVPWPDCLNRSFDNLRDEVYNTMWGPNEMLPTGKLANWDVTARLGGIRPPTLVTSGRYDECTPLVMETVHRAIPGSQWVIFEESSHLAHVEETGAYLEVLHGFFSDVETAERS